MIIWSGAIISIVFFWAATGESQSLLLSPDKYIGLPYREDGALSLAGFYTTFRTPWIPEEQPGLNCSGFVVAATRELLEKSGMSLSAAVVDREKNSGFFSPFGQDWDFGLDLILNLSEGFRRKEILPGSLLTSVDDVESQPSPRGFNLHQLTLWQQVLPRMNSGQVYLAAISKPYRKRGYQLIYYHVALILVDRFSVWFYHSTRKSGVHRLDLATRSGMRRFQKEFARSSYGDKYIYIIEVDRSGKLDSFDGKIDFSR